MNHKKNRKSISLWKNEKVIAFIKEKEPKIISSYINENGQKVNVYETRSAAGTHENLTRVKAALKYADNGMGFQKI